MRWGRFGPWSPAGALKTIENEAEFVVDEVMT